MQSKSTLLEALHQTTTQQFRFFVPGEPASQGSKNAIARIGRGKDGRPQAFANLVEQDKKLKPWRQSIGNMASLMLPSGWQTDGFYWLRTTFLLPRPKMHYSTKGGLKTSAPTFHSARKDCDKMVRAVGDALAGICYDDDSMVVSIEAVKLYESQSHGVGAWISVGRLDEGSASQAVLALIQ